MSISKNIVLCLLFVISSLLLGGCGKKADTEQPQPVATVQDEAPAVNVEQLRAKAMEYKNAIIAKKAEIEKVAAKLKAIPLTQQMGDEAKGLQTNMSDLTKSLSELTEKFQDCYNKLKEAGGDTAGLEI